MLKRNALSVPFFFMVCRTVGILVHSYEETEAQAEMA